MLKKTRKLSYERATRLVWQQTYSSILRISLVNCALLFSLNPAPFFIHNPEEVSFECVYVFLGSFLCLKCVLFVRSNLFVSDTQETGHDDHILHGLDLLTM